MAQEKKRILSGVVLESKMDKTAVVQVTRRFPHPRYKKFVTRSKKYYAHDDSNETRTGDTIRIIQAKPESKLKRWRVFQIDKRAAEV